MPAAITRRSVLAGAAAGIGVAATTPAYAATRVPLTLEEHRVVVIGSGFGGGVSALRLAQAGVPVLLLERGRRWPAGPDKDTFPTVQNLDKRALWYRSAPQVFGQPVIFDPYVGLLETISGDNITAIVAAGLGGGSLVYQGMTLQPAKDVFLSQFPEALDYDRMSAVHYPRVAAMLGAATAPDELISSPTYKASRVFARNVQRQGYALSKIPMPIDWSFALRELKGEMKPSYTNGDCGLGVNNGGKHSVDVTYIAQAEATGRVEVRTQHEVTDVARAKDGRWQVFVNRISTAGKVLEKLIITTPALIMAAGTMNTTRLLMRAAATGGIPDLPDALGTNWGSNADRIYVWTNLKDDFGAVQGGPVVYGSKEWDDPARANTIIQASIPPTGANLRSTMLVGFGASDGRGHFVYDSAKDDVTLRWPKNADAKVQSRIDARIKAVAGDWSLLTDTNGLLNSTWHALGGASMGSVCDLDGRVRGQKGLYVLDGALMPGNTAACNPSMTIAAVAERALDNLVVQDVGTLI